MDVTIKEFNVDMEVKTRGVEFEVRDNTGEHLADLILTSTRLIWCNGRTRRDNGIGIDWEDFIDLMNEEGLGWTLLPHQRL